jgi:hypothetical protein
VLQPFVFNGSAKSSPPALLFNKSLVVLNTELKPASVNTHWEMKKVSIQNNREIYLPSTFTQMLNETASGGNPDVRFPVSLYTLKI